MTARAGSDAARHPAPAEVHIVEVEEHLQLIRHKIEIYQDVAAEAIRLGDIILRANHRRLLSTVSSKSAIVDCQSIG